MTHANPYADPFGDPNAPAKRAAIIANPVKFGANDPVRGQIDESCRRVGWAPPLWLETTVEDPGTGQATQAREAGVDLVCPLGGDGTVRAVAAGLVGSDTPMGLLPGGTGNLLARNLDLPIDSIEHAMFVALTGNDRRIDVGLLNVVAPAETQQVPKDYHFLVVAGLGFDADVMARIDETMKSRLGWAAYVVAGLREMGGSRFLVRVSFDEQPAFRRRVRTVMVGNCGRIQLGVSLLPDAEVDDGELDAVLVSPKGVIGWAAVVAQIVAASKGHPRVDHHRCQTMRLHLEQPQEVQLDGDPIGPAVDLAATILPKSLVVRVAG